MKSGQQIPEELLDHAVAGLNLVPGNLRDQLGPGPTLLVFLRQLGCIFCRETLADMRVMAEKDPRFPKPLFFFQGTTTEGRALLRRYWPSLPAIADPKLTFYDGFGIERGGLLKMFSPEVWSAKTRAKEKGHENGLPSGDIWRMPGALLVHHDEVIWAHDYRHAADHPDYEVICETSAAATSLRQTP